MELVIAECINDAEAYNTEIYTKWNMSVDNEWIEYKCDLYRNIV